MPASMDNGISRRATLKGMAILAGTATAVSVAPMLVSAANASGVFSDPDIAKSALNNPGWVSAYKDLMAECVPDFDRSLLDGIEHLYVLNCETRGLPLDNGVLLNANTILSEDNLYKGTDTDRAVAPTMTFTRGRTQGVLFGNTMVNCGTSDGTVSNYTPHGYTVVNLHTHGLHVSPNTPQDNVLIQITPVAAALGQFNAKNVVCGGDVYAGSFPYYYSLPADHPVGTFWYHPHKHGSVSAQMAVGMAGALIVRSNGAGDEDIDDILAAAPYNITEADERILVLESINYYPTTADPSVAVFDAQQYYYGAPSDGCTPHGDIAQIFAVNGISQPTITMRPGEIQRWRIINTAVGQTFVPMFQSASGATLPTVHALATDGITLPPPSLGGDDNAPYFEIDYSLTTADGSKYWTTAEIITVTAGQRLDILVQAPTTPGEYTFVGAKDGDAPSVAVAGGLTATTLLTVIVEGDARADQTLPTLKTYRDPRIKRPTAVVPPADGKATQDINYASVTPDPPAQPASFLINGEYFEQSGSAIPPQLELKLNAKDYWKIYSSAGVHMHHIHVNPFQIYSRNDSQMDIPMWRDTVYVDAGAGDAAPSFDKYAVYATSEQIRYTGEFVVHCHNLNHEDKGMMLTVAIT